MKNQKTKPLVLAALFLALGVVFPQLFHAIGAGPVFLPMHIPVLLCGLICGWQYGGICGLVVPLLSSLLAGMPPLWPTCPSMMLELCAYGLLTGLLYRKLRLNVYAALVAAMLGGRVVSGLANALFMGLADKPYGFSAFLSGAFATALPGIVVQLVLVPLLVLGLQKATLIQPPTAAKTGGTQL